MPLIFFHYQLVLSGPPSTTWNTSSPSAHPRLASALRVKFSLAPRSVVLTLRFSQMPFMRMRNFLPFPAHGMFLLWQGFRISSNAFLQLRRSGDMDFCLQHILVYYFNRFSCVEPHLHPWGKSHLVMVYNFLMMLDSVCYYFIEDFYIYFHKECWSAVFWWFLWLALESR